MRASLVVIMMEALYARWLGHDTLRADPNNGFNLGKWSGEWKGKKKTR